MAELIVTCAGCGKRFRGSASGKKSKCGTCSNLLTFPTEPKVPESGTILCSNCWTALEPKDGLEKCPSCQQKVSVKLGGGKATGLSAIGGVRPGASGAIKVAASGVTKVAQSGSHVAPPPVLAAEPPAPPAPPPPSPPAQEQPHIGVTDTSAGFPQGQSLADALGLESAAQQAQQEQQPQQEQQEQQEQPQEQQPQEQPQQEQQAAAAAGAEASAPAEGQSLAAALGLEDAAQQGQQEQPQQEQAPAGEGQVSLDGLPPEIAQIVNERDQAIIARKQLDKVVAELMAQVAFLKASQAAQSAEADQPAKWELQMEVGELKSKVDSLGENVKTAQKDRDEARKARDEIDDARRKLEARVFELEGQLAQLEQAQAQNQGHASSAAMAAASPDAERRIAQLEQDLAAAREGRAAATKERDDALAKTSAAQADLDRFREAAVQALEPLGLEYNKSMKELINETEALLLNTRQQHEETNLRMAQLENLGGTLKDHLLMVRRQMAQRLAAVLGGSVPDESQFQPAVPPPQAPAAPATPPNPPPAAP